MVVKHPPLYNFLPFKYMLIIYPVGRWTDRYKWTGSVAWFCIIYLAIWLSNLYLMLVLPYRADVFISTLDLLAVINWKSVCAIVMITKYLHMLTPDASICSVLFIWKWIRKPLIFIYDFNEPTLPTGSILHSLLFVIAVLSIILLLIWLWVNIQGSISGTCPDLLFTDASGLDASVGDPTGSSHHNCFEIMQFSWICPFLTSNHQIYSKAKNWLELC